MAEDNIKAIIEALLFTAERPLSAERIKDVLDHLSLDEIHLAIGELKSEYERINRGIRITEVAGGFQIVTLSALAPFLKRIYKQQRARRLSKPALETLAIIAYKQPVTKLEIESLRNVNVEGVIDSLLDNELIRISGRKKAPGRPHVFSTTKQFLECFGLNSLNDLPKMEDFSKLAQAKEAEILKEGDNKTEEAYDVSRPTQTD